MTARSSRSGSSSSRALRVLPQLQGPPHAPALLRQAVVGLIIVMTPKFPAAAGGRREKPCYSNRWLRAVLFYFNVLSESI